MAKFRIVFLRESILEASEVIETEDLLKAVQKASSDRLDVTAEIWSCGRKVAVIRPFEYRQRL